MKKDHDGYDEQCLIDSSHKWFCLNEKASACCTVKHLPIEVATASSLLVENYENENKTEHNTHSSGPSTIYVSLNRRSRSREISLLVSRCQPVGRCYSRWQQPALFFRGWFTDLRLPAGSIECEVQKWITMEPIGVASQSMRRFPIFSTILLVRTLNPSLPSPTLLRSLTIPSLLFLSTFCIPSLRTVSPPVHTFYKFTTSVTTGCISSNLSNCQNSSFRNNINHSRILPGKKQELIQRTQQNQNHEKLNENVLKTEPFCNRTRRILFSHIHGVV